MFKGVWMILITVFLTLGLFSLSTAEESITITTYYPSPYGSYNDLYVANNVGIGTASPASKLNISGGDTSLNFPNPGSSNLGAIHFSNPNNLNAQAITFDDDVPGNAAQAGIYVTNNHADGTRMYLATTSDYSIGPQTRVMINNYGNVGIGTANPGTRLAVAGLSGSSSGSYLRYLTDGTGKIYYDSSSIKYKDHVELLKDDFNKVLRLEPRSFIDKATGNKEIGYIAEELDILGLKNLVAYKNNEPDSIKYDRLVLYLIEVVKDQQKRIDEIEAKLK